MAREITLTYGQVALVDDADFDAIVAVGKWYAKPGVDTFYACRTFYLSGRQWTGRMHNFVTGWDFVDHVNGNGLDNRRENLRPADDSKNMMNSRVGRHNTSGFKGVSRDGNRWAARISLRGRTINLGGFATPADAARAYDEAAVFYFGEFARPNFLQECDE